MSWSETVGVAKVAGAWKIFKSITFSRGADRAMTLLRIRSPSAPHAIKKLIDNHKDACYRLNLRSICSGIEPEEDALETGVLILIGCPRTDV
jgi:hypothetical protein